MNPLPISIRSVVAAASALVFIASSRTQAQWTVTILHPPGATNSGATGVSAGQQVGTIDGNRAVTWSGTAASMQVLTPAPMTGECVGVSNGVQVGSRGQPGLVESGLWTGTPASFVPLSTSLGSTQLFGAGAGMQVGTVYAHSNAESHAAVWFGSSGSFVDLSPANSSGSFAFAADSGMQGGTANINGRYQAGFWRGNAASWNSLSSVGATADSAVLSMSGTQQVGSVSSADGYIPYLWNGSSSPPSASLLPSGPLSGNYTQATGVSCGVQVGSLEGVDYQNASRFSHAALWTGTRDSWVDLHDFLPPNYQSSFALGVSRDAAGTSVAGYAFDPSLQQSHAILWFRPADPAAAPTWTRVAPPPRNAELASAYDSARRVVVLYGGDSSPDATWEWNGSQWSFRTSQFGRRGHTMAYDAARGVTVVHGGFASPSGTRTAFTQTWNGNTWTLRNISGIGGARSGHAMVYDAARQLVTLYGGRVGAGAGTLNNETWVWNGTIWSQRMVATPPAREGHAMAYDPIRGVTVMFGGQTASGTTNETWEWNGVAWMQRFFAAPPARVNHIMVYDSARGVIVMHGGYSLPGGTLAPFGDTWEYSSTSGWVPFGQSIAAPRYGASAAYDEARSKVVLFGGIGPDSRLLFGETLLRSATGAWSIASGSAPPQGPTAYAYDLTRQTGVVYLDNSRTVWEWSAGLWNEVSPTGPSPSSRSHSDMAFHPGRNRVVLFGGIDPSNIRLGDTWEWDGTSWSSIPGSGPSPRSDVAVTTGTNNNLLLFGGSLGQAGNSAETWELSYTGQWTRRLVSGPSPRSSSAIAFDRKRNVVVLYGGVDIAALDDTWEWSGSIWVRRDVTGPSPGPRANATMTFDESRGVVVLAGGSSTDHSSWEWDGCSWRQVASPGPTNAISAAFFHDVATNTSVHFGGEYGSDTWTLSAPCVAPVITQQPVGVRISENDTATFRVVASGSGPMEYQWQVVPASNPMNEVPLIAGNNYVFSVDRRDGIVSGAQSETLVVRRPHETGWLVQCVVRSGSGHCGSVASDAVPLDVIEANVLWSQSHGYDVDNLSVFGCNQIRPPNTCYAVSDIHVPLGGWRVSRVSTYFYNPHDPGLNLTANAYSGYLYIQPKSSLSPTVPPGQGARVPLSITEYGPVGAGGAGVLVRMSRIGLNVTLTQGDYWIGLTPELPIDSTNIPWDSVAASTIIGLPSMGYSSSSLGWLPITLPDTVDAAILIQGNALSCIADIDDGSGTGTPDGGVTIDDLLYYLFLFEAGDLRADVDDGSSTGTPDGGVTIDDLLYYLGRFEAGC